MQEPIIVIRDLTKVYRSPAGEVSALRGVDLTVAPGTLVVVTGKSGSGKTTLVNMLTGLDRVTAGEVWVDGAPVHNFGLERAARWRGLHAGVVFQAFELLPSLSVLHNVMLPMDFAGTYAPRVLRPRAARRSRALGLLDQVGIADHAHKLPSEVSGGQRQRVAIARALANDPPLIVADEPTGSLDTKTAATVMDLFESLVAMGKTVVLVTHDLELAARGTRQVVLRDGVLEEGVLCEVDQRVSPPQSEVTRQMVASLVGGA